MVALKYEYRRLDQPFMTGLYVGLGFIFAQFVFFLFSLLTLVVLGVIAAG